MKQKILTLIGGICAILILAGLPFISACAEPAPPAKAIELSFNIVWTATHANYGATMAWAEEVERRTDGRVKIVPYPKGTLTKAAAIYDGVVTGISDIGVSCLAYTPGRFPLMEAVDLPLGYPSGYVATSAADAAYRKFTPKELSDAHMLFVMAHGPGLVHTKGKPVRCLEDLAGMKIRSTGLAAKIVKALGATPVSIGMPDTYEALQKGTVDGTLAPPSVMKDWKQAEVVDYTTACYSIGYTTAFFITMNLDKWNSLPADIQKVFTDVSKEEVPIFGKHWDACDAAGLEFIEEMGNEIIELSPQESARWAKAVAGLADEYVADQEAEGLPAREFLDEVQRLIKEYSK